MAEDGLTRLERKARLAQEAIEAPSGPEVLQLIAESLQQEIDAVDAYESRAARMKQLSHKGTLPVNTQVWDAFKELRDDSRKRWQKLSYIHQSLTKGGELPWS